MLSSILFETETSVSLIDAVICILVAFVMGGVISVTHRFKAKSSPNFLLTLALLPALVQIIIFLVNGNLGTAFAVAGAFSLIRFRSVAGNSKEILSVFWAMATGLGLGMGYIIYVVIVTVIIAIFMILVTILTEKTRDKEERKLKIVIPENLDYQEVFNDLFEKYTDKIELRKVKTTNMGSTYELVYSVNIKENLKEKEFLDDIRCRNGNMLVMLEREEISEVEL